MKIQMDISSQTRSVRKVVYEKLREAIITGYYKPGDHLNERQLAKEFNISTTPLKEALRGLEQEGFVITKPRIGSFVSSNMTNFIEEINLIRGALEGVAARLAADKITDEEIAQLGEIIDKMKKYSKEKNFEKLFAENDNFHHLIRLFARNNYILKQLDSIKSIDVLFRKKALSYPDEMDRSFDDHFQIYKMIVSRNPKNAEIKMRYHIDRTLNFINKADKF